MVVVDADGLLDPVEHDHILQVNYQETVEHECRVLPLLLGAATTVHLLAQVLRDEINEGLVFLLKLLQKRFRVFQLGRVQGLPEPYWPRLVLFCYFLLNSFDNEVLDQKTCTEFSCIFLSLQLLRL